ncbi:hypothetical protein ACFL2V_17660 [Pseudomonadota bacterium]
MSDEYCFTETSDEYVRFKLLQGEFDEVTVRRFGKCNIQAGNDCLDIGLGEDSIACWMAREVGDSGKVATVDKHPKCFIFL